MQTAAKLGAFGAALALTFGGAYALGQGTGAMGGHDMGAAAPSGAGHDMGGESGHGSMGGPTAGPGGTQLPGLAVTADGYTLSPQAALLTRGPATAFRFSVTGRDGRPLTSYTPSHTKDLHLVVVRRDFAGFQHVHPVRSADGVWSTALDLSRPGVYRVFADFVPGGASTPVVLGTDISVPGDYRPQQLPAPSTSATVDEYGIALRGTPSSSGPAELTFTVTRRGKPVSDLQPYLGSFGHLVALRAGDLAYLHTHPGQEARPGMTGGPSLSFGTELPSRGSYRLFLDFQVGGKVRTAAFTVTV